MDLVDDTEQARFRARLRDWLRTYAPREQPPTGVEELFWWRHDWHRALYKGGWVGVDLPVEFGGGGLDVVHRLIVIEELTAADAPPIANWVGVELVAPTLLRCGTERQQRTHVPAILDGREVWCQAFSEADAGSDLAAVRTTATTDGAGFVLHGAKRWSSWSRFADHVLVLARTGPPESRHRGLTCFLVQADAPGLTITPIPMLYGDAEEGDVTFDGVRVSADAVLGAVDGGWKVLMTNLSFARGMATLTRVGTLRQSLVRLVRERVTGAGGAAALPAGEAAALATYYARVEALRGLAYRKVGELATDGVPGPIASTEKLLWGELSKELAGYAVALGGLDALQQPDGPVATGWPMELFRGLGNAIEGGTSEIQRSTIARHVLGLPA